MTFVYSFSASQPFLWRTKFWV